MAAGQEWEAFDAFYKSTWSAETQSAGFYWPRCLSARQGKLEEALGFVENSLVRNWHNQKGRVLKGALLRLLGRDNRGPVSYTHLAVYKRQMGTQGLPSRSR